MRYIVLYLFTICLFISCKPSSADTSDAAMDDIELLQKECGVVLSFPPDMISTCKVSDNSHVLSFGVPGNYEKASLEYRTMGLVIRLSDDCNVVVSDIADETELIAEPYNMTDSNYVSRFESLMLINRGFPWSKEFFFENQDIASPERRLWPKEQNKLLAPYDLNTERMFNDRARQENVYVLTDNDLSGTTNADSVFVVRIINLHTVTCQDKSWIEGVKNGADRLYGVEFYRRSNPHFVGMLVFFNSRKGKSIDEYVDELSRYIRFDPDFNFEE